MPLQRCCALWADIVRIRNGLTGYPAGLPLFGNSTWQFVANTLHQLEAVETQAAPDN